MLDVQVCIPVINFNSVSNLSLKHLLFFRSFIVIHRKPYIYVKLQKF